MEGYAELWMNMVDQGVWDDMDDWMEHCVLTAPPGHHQCGWQDGHARADQGRHRAGDPADKGRLRR
eukprot:757845-Pyramimonas_sp.AAC.1